MRRLTHMRIVAAAVLATALMPTALCFGAVTSSPHQCCTKQESGVQDGRGANNECCVVSAPPPNQAAVTSTDPGSKAAAPVVVTGEPIALTAEQTLAAAATPEDSLPGLTGRTILRI